MKKKGNINDWNAKIDHTFSIIGANGIHYEYLMPLHSFDSKYYEQAIDVRSRNKKTGRYQPIGDKSYFTFYQLKKMRDRGENDEYIKEIEQIINNFYKGLEEGLNNI